MAPLIRRAPLAPILCAVLAAAPLRAQADAGLPAAAVEAIEACITRLLEERRIPGLTAAIGAGDRVVWTRGFGLADVENEVRATERTVYRLASISKPITAVAAMQLAEADVLDLDAPVQRYVASFPQKRWPLTARQLLGHLGGVRHYRSGEIGSAVRYDSLESALVIFANDPLLFEPGTRYRYTTYGYNLLGCVVEGAAKQTFFDYVRTHVLEPAGMTATRIDDARAIIPWRAQGYRYRGGVLENAALVDTSNKIPGGGLCGTAADLVRFAIALRTGVLVRAETRELMWTSMKTADGAATGYGCGFGCREARGERVLAHSGGQPRVSTQLVLLPDRRVEVALMCNLEGVRLFGLATELAFLVPN